MHIVSRGASVGSIFAEPMSVIVAAHLPVLRFLQPLSRPALHSLSLSRSV